MRQTAFFAPTALLLLIPSALSAQNPRDLVKEGSSALPKLQEMLKDPSAELRVEAVKAIVQIGTQHSLDPLIIATRDSDPEVQIRATDGLVNFYLPDYVKFGLTASLKRAGSRLSAKFTGDNDQIVDSFIKPRPDVVEALGKLARGGIAMEVRANAARAVGILRGREAIPDLLEAVRSKNTDVIYESLIAFQKIRDPEVAPRISFLLRDLDSKVQIAAVETTGLLQNKEALPGLLDVFNRTNKKPVRRAALTAMAMIGDEASRGVFLRSLTDKDEGLRAAAAEGLARLKNPADVPVLEKAFAEEKKASPRISMAFALVMLGKEEVSEFSPLQLLVNTLNSTVRQGEAYALLIELARTPSVRNSLYSYLSGGTKDELIHLSRILARSGDKDSVQHLETVSRNPDAEVAQEGLRALRTLKARL
ncbi:MAG: HEAT repeat domain-containing protein [Bryobacteraceae bacterium]